MQDSIASSVGDLIDDLQPTLQNLVPTATLLANLQSLSTQLTDATLQGDLAPLITEVQSILEGNKPGSAPPAAATMADFAPVLLGLLNLQNSFQTWLTTAVIDETLQESLNAAIANAITQVQQLLNYRPDVGAVADDLTAMMNLQGGPADATAFHDFNALQLAFKSVWMHSFDANLQAAAAQLFETATALYPNLKEVFPDSGAIEDIAQLNEFINGLAGVTGILIGSDGTATNSTASAVVPPPSANVVYFYSNAVAVWSTLSDDQRTSVEQAASNMAQMQSSINAGTPNPNYLTLAELDNDAVAAIVETPLGTGGRLAQLINQIAAAQQEPYAFDVFAPDSYNFGLLITYRQIWQPGPYQAGSLVSTIPLAPGETRKYTHRTVVKTSTARKLAEKTNSSRSQETTEDSRAELDIMNRASNATNFKIASSGSINFGIGSMNVSSEFGGNTSAESTQNKKDFHEATLKAAEEYRQERSTEVDATSTMETDDTVSGEISNPNNEITVTYLFYELQRRFTVREFLYRVQPVILVAQDMPNPEQINEAWLLQYQWIIDRALLDDSLRPALTYLSSGYAGDQLSLAVLETQWKTQAALVGQLEALAQQQLTQRDQMRETLVEDQYDKDSLPEVPGIVNFAMFGMNPEDTLKKDLNAKIKAGQSRLKYMEQALADAQEKLKNAASAFQQATKDYSDALQNKFARQVAIDQIRIHVKQNIFYYMQAIWAYEDSDQRFFRLYNKTIVCPPADGNCMLNVTPVMSEGRVNGRIPITVPNTCVPGLDGEGLDETPEPLSTAADLDNPLGFKGNYIIFPLLDDCAITDYMLSDFVDTYLGLKDPDGSDDWDAEQFDDEWNQAVANNDTNQMATLHQQLLDNIEELNRRNDEIIVPTNQLFIEALPGTHPLLEQFKLDHRVLDLASVRAQNRHAELENLRLAARLAANPQVLQDPDIDKRIVVDKGIGVIMDSNP